LKLDLKFINHFKYDRQCYAAMLNQKSKHKEYRLRKTGADKRIEEVKARIEKLLEKMSKVEVQLARREKELEG